MDDALKDLGEYVAAAMPQDVIGMEVAFGELMITVRPASIVRVLSFLRDDSTCLFKVLIDLSGADYPERESRFEVIYSLLSISQNQRVRVKTNVAENVPVPTAIKVFSSAGWYERETWDMYGIYFTDHPDLRRLLTDYGFEGHPMRKDFPLTGRVEVRYDETQKRVVYDPVKLTQDFRDFDFLSPWEGMGEILPGDEKSSMDEEEGAEGP
ncbi:MAG: NADH-quinone oxidoreductase subunit C [Alphaproteobacteria bacterium]|nr:NADH-quinone oxidoreductase subunit C [Alphaproteobacteria bacterium]HCP00018.1 NADH-quinone oxidoreductase subunit C [Rhodospirillaceae bacterium]